MLQSKLKNENEPRAITPKVWCLEVCFLCTALLLNEIYLPMKLMPCIVLKLCSGQKRDGRVNHYKNILLIYKLYDWKVHGI